MKKNTTTKTDKTFVARNDSGAANKVIIQNKMNFTPKISVIMPVYNVEKFLPQCLDSIINQTLKEIEVICVDDGSTDGSLDILRQYAQKDSRISVLAQQNLFAGVARNAGINVAKGQYLHFMDSDDYLCADDVYEQLWQTVVKQNFCKIIRFRGKAFDDLTNNYIFDRKYEGYGFSFPTNNVYLNVLSEPDNFIRLSVVPWLGLIRRDFVLDKNLRFNNLRCCNDRSFFITSGLSAGDIFLANTYVVHHRVNNAASLRGVRDKFFDCHFKSIRIIHDFLNKNKMKDNVLKSVMVSEFNDMFYFFKKYYKKSANGYNIYTATVDFLKEFDLAAYKPQIEASTNYDMIKALYKHEKGTRLSYFFDKYFPAPRKFFQVVQRGRHKHFLIFGFPIIKIRNKEKE